MQSTAVLNDGQCWNGSSSLVGDVCTDRSCWNLHQWFLYVNPLSMLFIHLSPRLCTQHNHLLGGTIQVWSLLCSFANPPTTHMHLFSTKPARKQSTEGWITLFIIYALQYVCLSSLICHTQEITGCGPHLCHSTVETRAGWLAWRHWACNIDFQPRDAIREDREPPFTLQQV